MKDEQNMQMREEKQKDNSKIERRR